MKNTITITLLSFIMSFSSAYSQEIGKHSVYLGISPFGGGINIGHNLNEKTSINVGFGGAPEGDIPDGIKPEIEGFSEDYTHTAKSAWMGMFISHQPLDQRTDRSEGVYQTGPYLCAPRPGGDENTEWF